MKMSQLSFAVAAAVSSLAVSIPSQASPNGWFDCIDVGSVDYVRGWTCESTDPYNTPSYQSLDVYRDGDNTTGTYVGNFPLTNTNAYGFNYPGVNQAGYCGSDPYVGFTLASWFAGATVHIYWRDVYGNQTEMWGSPKHVTGGVGTYCN